MKRGFGLICGVQVFKNTMIASNSVRQPLSWALRWVTLLAGCGVLGILVTARCLVPDASGMGTHQQLGLPPCTSVVLFNAPCPACGMTTSWSLFTRGQFFAAVTTNAGGALLAIIALAYIPASCYFFTVGVASRGEWFSFGLAMSLIVAIVAAVLQWLWRW